MLQCYPSYKEYIKREKGLNNGGMPQIYNYF